MNIHKTKYLKSLTFGILFIILLLAYLNSFKGVWFFDDAPNIVESQALHITDLNVDTLVGTLFSGPGASKFPYRPIPCFTFALNWYIGQDNVFGYHVVNFLIHCFNAFLLFLTIRLLFCTPRLRKMAVDAKTVYWVALLAALLWGLHPIQIQGVTYIVQRMASMAAMFFLAGLYFYLRGCLANGKALKIRNWILCAICYVLALSCKANVMILPGALIITYWVFFLNGSLSKKYRLWGAVLLGLFIVGMLAVVWYFTMGPGIKNYAIRYFGMWERLLTEFRVIYLYLYQIFWPVPSSFHPEHYISVSTSLFAPISTFFALVGIIGMVVFAILKAARWPLLCFAILYFFCCHLVESTIVPLELIYEHRNYVPTMFMGIPIAFAFLRLLQYCKTRRPEMRKIVVCLGVFVMILIGFSTFLRNFVWQSETALYRAAIEKYPELSRSYINLGYLLLKETLSQEIAETGFIKMEAQPDLDPIFLEYLEKASKNAYFHRREGMSEMPLVYRAYGLDDKALERAKQNVELFPSDIEIQNILLALWLEHDDTDDGIAYYHERLRDVPDNYYYNMFLGVLYLEKGDGGRALKYLLTAINLPGADLVSDEDYAALLRRIGIANVLAGDYAGARPGFEANLTKDFDDERSIAALWLAGLDRAQGRGVSAEALGILKDDAIGFTNVNWKEIEGQKGLAPGFVSGLRDVLMENFAFYANADLNE